MDYLYKCINARTIHTLLGHAAELHFTDVCQKEKLESIWDHQISVSMTHFRLQDFGSHTPKPIHVFSNFSKPLRRMRAPFEGRRFLRKTLGRRWWCKLRRKFCFTGDKRKMKRSSAYPYPFGEEFVFHLVALSCHVSPNLNQIGI